MLNLLAELPDVLLTRPPQLAGKYAPLAPLRDGGGLLGKSSTNKNAAASADLLNYDGDSGEALVNTHE